MSEAFEDYLLDEKLHIHTTGNNRSFSDSYRYPYEPTTYAVLDRMVKSGYLSKEDVLLDYGSGLGRVPIYLNYKLGCKTYGVEVVEELYMGACENQKSYRAGQNICFVNEYAEKYTVPEEVTACFFFNPFSIEILKGVLKQILDSYYECSRDMLLFFYYPQDEYIAYLMGVDELEFVDEIDCLDLFSEEDQRNRVMIFSVCNN